MTAAAGTTIIKRKKVIAGGGHHGGAWKVAYADFVTAMMAFFLLMWLLNATSEEQRKGLAEYFDPRVPISRTSGGGASAFGGDSIFTEETLAKNGAGGTGQSASDAQRARGDSGATPDASARDGSALELTDLDNLFRGMSGESEAANELLQHIRTRVTDEGLVIELFDAAGKPLFEKGSARPTARMRALLKMVGRTAALVTNGLAIEGHTDSARFSTGVYSNWELSADRANAARRALTDAGIGAERMARVVGKADREPAEGRAADDPRNRRVAITLLRSDL